jgi:hypothetical protein
MDGGGLVGPRRPVGGPCRSVGVDIEEEVPDAGQFFPLPQYAGPGVITKVTLSISGIAGGVDYDVYNPQLGLTVPSGPTSWEVLLLGPDGTQDAAAVINTWYQGVSIPPCASCGMMSYAYPGPIGEILRRGSREVHPTPPKRPGRS